MPSVKSNASISPHDPYAECKVALLAGYEKIPVLLLDPNPSGEPAHAVLAKLLYPTAPTKTPSQRTIPLNPTHKKLSERDPQNSPRLQHPLMQIKIIHGPNPQNPILRTPRTDSIHQTPTGPTKVIRHCVACRDGVALGKFPEVLLAAEVGKGGGGDAEVGGEHRRGDFAAVGAVADEGGAEVLALGWLCVILRWPGLWTTRLGILGDGEWQRGCSHVRIQAARRRRSRLRSLGRVVGWRRSCRGESTSRRVWLLRLPFELVHLI